MADHPPISFSAGIFTSRLKRELLRRQTEPYRICCWPNSEDSKALTAAVNVGIDSHLEAVEFTSSHDHRGCPGVSITPETLPVLVRRLIEGDGWIEEETPSMREQRQEWQADLASAICSTLGIELI